MNEKLIAEKIAKKLTAESKGTVNFNAFRNVAGTISLIFKKRMNEGKLDDFYQDAMNFEDEVKFDFSKASKKLLTVYASRISAVRFDETDIASTSFGIIIILRGECNFESENEMTARNVLTDYLEKIGYKVV